jgi:putative protease
MWRELGAKRVILARELSLAEIKRISKETKNGGPELEVFGHGAMCMAYSGRCLMSNYMADRDANRGECAHTCRWKYGSRLHLTEETRPDEVITVADDEDGRGAFVFSSRDLRMVEYLDKLADAGVCAVKIEGRMKTPYYAASTVKAYRMALDDLAKDVKTYRKKIGYYTDETMKSSHRGYCTGFYFGKPDAGGNNYGESGYVQEYMFLGVVREYDAQMKLAVVEQRNRFCAGDKIEVLQKRGMGFEQTVGRIRDMNGADIEVADKVQQYVTIETEKPVSPYDIIRKKT